MVPVVAPVVGMVLAWLSPRWTRRTKVSAALVLCSAVVVAAAVSLSTLVLPGRPQPVDGFTVYPVIDHGTSAAWLVLLLGGAAACLGAGLWLALAGRRPRS